VWATAFAPWQKAHQPTRLRAEKPEPGGYDFVEKVYQKIAKLYLGFAWRHLPFTRLRKLSLDSVWVLWDNEQPVGYALEEANKTMLNISDLALLNEIDAAEAVAALATKFKSDYVQVTVSRPAAIASLRAAGYRIAHPNWSAFMVKPLVPEVSLESAQQLFGIGTDQFLISWLDET